MSEDKADKPLDFKSLKENVLEASEPVVEAVKKYQPYLGKGKYKADLEDMPKTLADFFRNAADAIESRKNLSEEEETSTGLAKVVEDTKLKKKAGDVADKGSKLLDTARSKLDEAKLDQKATGVVKNLRDTVKDAQLDKKAGDLAGSAGTTLAGLATPVVAAVTELAGKAGDTVKEAKFDKKAADVASTAGELVSNVGDTVSSYLKEAKLDKRAADVASTAGEVAATVGTALTGYLKEARLDQKVAEVAETLSGKVKDTGLDKKVADVTGVLGGKATEAVDLLSTKAKEVKLDKKLADAKLPEKVFTAANLIPGVEVKNPKKAAKQFRKRRKEVLKAVEAQQKELNKTLQQRGKEARKYIEARQRDIQTGKIRIPGYEPPKPKKGFPWGKTLLGTGLVYGGLAANNVRVWSNVPPLQSKLPGEAHYYRSRQGVVFYKEAGQAQDDKAPVVLIHGIGAGNHSYEWEPNFAAFAEQYHTYAFDLLGFGNSERPNLKYTAEVYIKQLTEFLDSVVGRPAMLVASSLCSSYAVQVAFRRPQMVEKLVLMEPTGIFWQTGESGPNLFGPLTGAAYSVLRAPVLGKSIYSQVASHAGIKSFMENQMFYDKSLATPEKIEQYWVAAHQDGAEYAPPSFFTGLLNAEIGETLSKIEQPVMIIWGKESKITPLPERKAISEKNPRARVETLANARLSVNQEQAETFNRLALEFLGQPSQAPARTEGTVGFVQGQAQPVETEVEPSKTGKKRDTNQQNASNPASNPEAGKDMPHDQTDMGAVESKRSGRSEKKDAPDNSLEAAETGESQGQGLEFDNSNLRQELEEHRKTFIGDADTGGALVQDADHDGVDDRQM